MQASLRECFGASCETYSPSEGSCDLFVSSNQRWVSWKQVRAAAKANRWTYEVVLEGAQTRVRFMMGSPLWEYATAVADVLANTTIKHALDNGLFCPKSKSTKAEHVGTTETVHINATPRCATRVSVRLAEALLDRADVLDIQLRRGSISVVCLSRNHQNPSARWNECPTSGSKEAEDRIQRALRKIRRHNRRATAARQGRTSGEGRRAGKVERRMPCVRGRAVPSAFPVGAVGPAPEELACAAAPGAQQLKL